LAIYLGQIRGGLPGLIVAGAAFILPAVLLVVGLAWAYARYGTLAQVGGLLFGVKPVVVVLIAQAVWLLGKSALRTLPLAALTWVVLTEARALRKKSSAILLVLRRITVSPAPAITAGLAPVFLYFLKVGAVLFGSGYVLLALLRADLVVRLHWLSESQLLDAIAISQATPGPFFTVSTFIGYLLGGWRGAILATVGMFVPAFVYVATTANFLPRLRQSRLAGTFLDGVNAGAVALMAFVGGQFARATLVSVPALVLAAISGLLVFRYRVNSAWVIAGAALSGLLLSSFHWN
jgi:chromate transporter